MAITKTTDERTAGRGAVEKPNVPRPRLSDDPFSDPGPIKKEVLIHLIKRYDVPGSRRVEVWSEKDDIQSTKETVYIKGNPNAIKLQEMPFDKFQSLLSTLGFTKTSLKDAIIEYENITGDAKFYITGLLPVMVGRSGTIEEYQKWDKAVKDFLKEVEQNFGKTCAKRMGKEAVPQMVKEAKDPEELAEKFGVAMLSLSD